MKRTPIHPVSKKKRRALREYFKVRRWVASRADGLCEAQVSDVCEGHGVHAHHIVMRSAGGPDDLGNLLWVCLPCHRFIHANSEWSYERGLLRRRTA